MRENYFLSVSLAYFNNSSTGSVDVFCWWLKWYICCLLRGNFAMFSGLDGPLASFRTLSLTVREGSFATRSFIVFNRLFSQGKNGLLWTDEPWLWTSTSIWYWRYNMILEKTSIVNYVSVFTEKQKIWAAQPRVIFFWSWTWDGIGHFAEFPGMSLQWPCKFLPLRKYPSGFRLSMCTFSECVGKFHSYRSLYLPSLWFGGIHKKRFVCSYPQGYFWTLQFSVNVTISQNFHSFQWCDPLLFFFLKYRRSHVAVIIIGQFAVFL